MLTPTFWVAEQYYRINFSATVIEHEFSKEQSFPNNLEFSGKYY